MNRLFTRGLLAAVLPACALAAGCAPGPAGPPLGQMPQKAPEVLVGLPVRKTVTDYEETTGRVEPVRSVEVRARATGYLQKVNFLEGSEVQEGEVLMEIDPRPYQAELDRAEANVAQAEAHLTRLKSDFERATVLRGRDAIGREEFDKVSGDRNEALAAVQVAKAARDLARLNLEFCKVKAPIDGLVSRKFIDVGNLVKADETPLTTIVTQDPMFAYFDVDERTLLRLRRLMQEGVLPSSPGTSGITVEMGLADEDGFPHRGKIDFVDNRLDNNTGTLHMRCVFPNPRRLLTPGLFVRFRVPIGQPHPVTLAPEEALGTDQGRKFLYVLDGEDKVQYRPVKVGKLYEGYRVITDGLKEGERIVVDGLQRVRPGIQVAPKDAPPQKVAAGEPGQKAKG